MEIQEDTRQANTGAIQPQAKPLRKPDRLSHLRRALELAGILAGRKDYTPADLLIKEFQEIDPSSLIDESGVKRCFRTFESVANKKVIESRPGRGYRLIQEKADDRVWISHVLAEYVTLTDPKAGIHPAIDSLVFQHGYHSLHYIVIIRIACDRNLPLRFMYARSGQKKAIERYVQALALLIRGQRVLLLAVDLKSKKLRQFILTRISGPISLEKNSTITPQELDLTHVYKHSLSLFIGPRPESVQIRFDPQLSTDIQREFFHSSQSIKESEKGLFVDLRVNNEEEVFALVSRYLGKAEIIKPIAWRTEYFKRLSEAKMLHQDQGRK